MTRLLPTLGSWLVAAVVCSLVSSAAGQVFVEQVSPPSLLRGASAEVTLIGAELDRATGLWTSLPAGKLRSMPLVVSELTRAAFRVELDSDAPLGIHGLRVATDNGLSNVHLFLVDDLPAIAEVEPNNASDVPQRVSLPIAVQGQCREFDIDRYQIDVAAGQHVSFEVVGSRLGQDFDPLVTIYDASGRELASRDNDVGLVFDSRFEHTFAAAGPYVVEVRDARFHGCEHCGYVLRMGEFPAARIALPMTVRAGEQAPVLFPQLGTEPFVISPPAGTPARSFLFGLRRPSDQASVWVPLTVDDVAVCVEQEPNDAPETAPLIALPAAVHGQFSGRSDRDWFAFDANQGDRLNLRIDGRVWGSPADMELVVADQTGKELLRVDTEVRGEAAAEFTAPAAGRYGVLVRELTRRDGPEFVYRVRIEPRQPRLVLDSAADQLAICQGSSQPLPLTLVRTDFDGAADLQLAGAPPGMSLRTTSIPAGATSVENGIAVDGTTPLGAYTVRVIARAQAGERVLSAVAQTRPLIDRLPSGRGPHGEPFELREDQRLLPPSLIDQIAVLVLPAAPFSFELPDALVTLPRYQRAEFRLVTERTAGFDAPIDFVARGGTLEPLNLQEPRVRAVIPQATGEQHEVVGVLHSGVNSELTRHAVTVTGTAVHEGRRISLSRRFELELKQAFNPSPELVRIELPPGGKTRVKLLANRLLPFADEVLVKPSPTPGILLPESLAIPAGQESIEIDLAVAADAKPASYTIAFPGSARVDRFFEETSGAKLEVVVTAPAATTATGGAP